MSLEQVLRVCLPSPTYLEWRYRGIPFRRAVWREIPVVAIIFLWSYLVAFLYRAGHAAP